MLPLSDGHVLFKVVVLEGLQLLLELLSLSVVRVHNRGKHIDVALALVGGQIEEGAEVKFPRLPLHHGVADSGGVGSIALDLEGGEILLVVDTSEIDQ